MSIGLVLGLVVLILVVFGILIACNFLRVEVIWSIVWVSGLLFIIMSGVGLMCSACRMLRVISVGSVCWSYVVLTFGISVVILVMAR